MPQYLVCIRNSKPRTFINIVTDRRVINQTNFSQVSFYYSKVFGI